MQQEHAQVSVPRRILGTLLNALSAGVVPRVGAPYIAIGRTEETAALRRDLDVVEDGGAAMRFLIGPYGSGKSFLLQLMRGVAQDRGFVTADADLSPERKICGTKGQGIATYRELIANLATKSSPLGGALPGMIGKWFSALQTEIASGGISPETPAFDRAFDEKIFAVCGTLESEIGGFDFAQVLQQYYRAYMAGDEEKKRDCMRWLRGEYPTRTEARAALGVGSIIDDGNWYEHLKLMGVFFRRIGYAGFLVILDECVNLYKISNRVSRENNYEKLLSMFNDALQGKAQGLMMLLGGTPQFLEDRRRGLFSYEALRSRLCEGQFDRGEYQNFLGPVIRLRRLSDTELLALTQRLCVLHGQYYRWQVRASEEDMVGFVSYCLSRAGADTMITPREIIRDWCSVLNILMQNPQATVQSILQSGNTVRLTHAQPGDDAWNDDVPNADAGQEVMQNIGKAGTVNHGGVKDTSTAAENSKHAQDRPNVPAFDLTPDDIEI